jgi:hypothetical protein
MIVKAFPLERAGEPLDKRLFLGDFGFCPVLGNAQGSKIALRVFHVFATPWQIRGFTDSNYKIYLTIQEKEVKIV